MRQVLLYLSGHQHPDQQMNNVEFTDFRLQGNTVQTQRDGFLEDLAT